MRLPPEGVLIIGFGNPLRGDDGAGPYAARKLRCRGFSALEAHQLTPELAEAVSRVELSVFIDSRADLAPGEVRAEPVQESGHPELEHHASPGSILRLARQVYGRVPQALIVTIGAESYDLGRPLSDCVLRAVETLVEEWVAPSRESFGNEQR
ncbi:MAG: hydrogenase maturation protease [Acidobacteriia bacterium]|nr:hydrogenase maturation protease [Terriglobia bacterium]